MLPDVSVNVKYTNPGPRELAGRANTTHGPGRQPVAHAWNAPPESYLYIDFTLPQLDGSTGLSHSTP